MALDNFYKGINDGMGISKDAYDARLKTAKDELVMQGLYDTYGDNQLLRADTLRNQMAQLNLDTAKRDAALNGLYRTHDITTDAAVSQGLYNKTNYDNLTSDIDMWGQIRREAERKRLEAAKAQYGNALFSEELKSDINTNTRPIQYDTGKNQVIADNNLSQDKVFDTQTQLDINPSVWVATTTNADTNAINAKTTNTIAKDTQPYVISKATSDAIYGDQNSAYNLDVLMNTKDYNLETATKMAYMKARDAQSQAAIKDVSLIVAGIPTDQQEAYLANLAKTTKDPYVQIASQSMLNEINTQRASRQVASEQAAQAGYVMLGDGKFYKVNDGKTTTVTNPDGSVTTIKLSPEEKSQLAVQEDAYKRINALIATLSNDADGYTEEDKQKVAQAKAEMGISGNAAAGTTAAGVPRVSFTNDQQADYLEYGVKNLGWKFDQGQGLFHKPDGSQVTDADFLAVRKSVENQRTRQVANAAMQYAINKYGWKEDKASKGWFTKDGKRVTPAQFQSVMAEYQSSK